MANIKDSLDELMQLDGALACCVVDGSTGMVMGKAGGGVDLDVAAAGNTEVVRAKMKTMGALNLNDTIEDILITLGKQFHVIRPFVTMPGVFVYLVLDKNRANLAMARIKVQSVENSMKV